MGFGMQWHQLDHTQTICTSLQTDNHTNTSSLNVQIVSKTFAKTNRIKTKIVHSPKKTRTRRKLQKAQNTVIYFALLERL